jgi:N-carbamoyl-L-amino-acid hydrolase
MNIFKNIRINTERFKANFDTLAQIGATVEGGIHRPTFSPAHLQAREWFRQQVYNAGLRFCVDSAGNHSAIYACGEKDAPAFLLGSHLDSVPNGGRFDGALGVVAALEVLLSIQDAAISLPFHLEAIDFTDEEGTLVGLLGSTALAGKLKPKEISEPRGGRENLLTGLKEAGLTEEGLLNAQRDPASLAGYLELHIEQGGNLIAAQADAGVVTSIVGITSYRLTFIGRANHAGTTSMTSRLDASQGASAFTLSARELVIEKYPDCVVNIGDMHFEPGAFNIIPEHVTASLEFRAPEDNVFTQLDKALIELAHQEAERFNLDLEIEFLGKHAPAPMSQQVQNTILKAAQTLDLAAIPLASGAGHDAQSLADLCPTGMIFVPSIDGVSHSPREFTKWKDCINGANLLLQTVLEIATGAKQM